MRYNHLCWILVVIVASSGCHLLNPLRAVTHSDVTMHSSPVEDRGPLAEMPVMPDQGAVHGKIALIDVDGLLLNQRFTGTGSVGENPVSVFREKLDRVAADPCYRAVVLRINSPGGSVTASDIMWRDLRAFQADTQLPVVACLMDVGAGGAYYLATPADHIVAHPTAITGGIGVILNLYNLTEAMLQYNVAAIPVKAGENIDLGTPAQTLTEEGRQVLQEIADQFHERFRDVVKQTRPEVDASRTDVLDGRVFTASQALELKLIDSVGYLDDAVALARQFGNCPAARVVILHRSHDRARSPYDSTPNTPFQGNLLPVSIPGYERSQMPTFLYLWQPEPTIVRRASGM